MENRETWRKREKEGKERREGETEADRYEKRKQEVRIMVKEGQIREREQMGKRKSGKED